MKPLINALKGADNVLGRIAEVLTAASICVQMVVMFAGVCFRYFFKSPLTWSDELSCYLLVLVTFFGGYVALRTNAMAKIELVLNLFPPKIKKLSILLANILIVVLMIAVIYYGTMLVLSPVIMKQRTPAMQLPMYWFYSIIPIASAMMIVRVFVMIYDMFQREGDKC
ncbi:TRAP transporter small permease [Neomoorella thermoacetica]|uniref:TRAP transporter small permease n=1 Tax=Neomoorella thermoacetica TaxID=1525 RepID=UPI0030D1D87B